MGNIAIYLFDEPFPIVIAAEGKSPSDLLLSGSASGQVEGLALEAEGGVIARPVRVTVAFGRIRRIALSSDGESDPDSP